MANEPSVTLCKAIRRKERIQGWFALSFVVSAAKSSMSSKMRLDNEINRITFLCAQIRQRSEMIRSSRRYLAGDREELLSAIETIDGAALLLESLLQTQQRYLQPRVAYDRQTLLELRQSVSPNLSTETRKALQEVVDRETPTTLPSKKTPKCDIRSILSWTFFRWRCVKRRGMTHPLTLCLVSPLFFFFASLLVNMVMMIVDMIRRLPMDNEQ